jgi:diguanylate cyclase (GGDEF)-like protein/PAS domain S-box-containing protein
MAAGERADPRPHSRAAVQGGARGACWSIDDLPIALIVFEDGDVVAVNEAWTELTGLGLDRSRGNTWLSAIHRDDRSAVRRFVRDVCQGDPSTGTWRVLRAGARGEAWTHLHARMVETEHVRSCLLTLTTREPSASADSGLLHLATHDPLTGALNRSSFMAHVDEALAEVTGAPEITGVLFVDLDRFKQVNDDLGHHAGDLVLVAVCRRIQSVLRTRDRLGRLGGDEFGVLLSALDTSDDAQLLAERIVETVSEPFDIEGDTVRIGASVGIAISNGDAVTAATLLDSADHAMYRAKAEGRRRWATIADPVGEEGGVDGEARAVVAQAMVVVSRAERHVLELWRHATIDLRDGGVSTRLADAGHVLRHARMALDDDLSIGAIGDFVPGERTSPHLG